MRPFLCAAGAALVVSLSGSRARAQDIAPPPPMDPGGMPPSAPPPFDPNAQPGVDPNAQPGEQATKQKLDEAEREDSGRRFEIFWADLHLGASYIGMNQLSEDALTVEKPSSFGPMFGIGAGLRLVVFVAGVRAKYNALSAFNMWQLNLEAGLKFPIDRVDILIGGHGGYSFVGSLGEGAVASGSAAAPTLRDAVKVRGWNAGVDLAFDYYVSPAFSVGLGVFGDFLFLQRPPIEIPAGTPDEARVQIQADPNYQLSGTSAGMQFGGALRLGFHLGL
ncbi:MAG: hypothetical protein KF819_13855 [Labilithrix sp.]|nr:hypothetical protein [Labilithrix sp.]